MAENELQVQLDKMLDQYTDRQKEIIAECITEVAKETAKDLKQTSPKDKGNYAKSWNYKVSKGAGKSLTATIYNKNHGGLTHLLERGHVIKNQSGSYGRTAAQPHIAPAEEKATQELVALLERRL